MKKISVFILLIAATFASCSKDDDGGSEISEANLVGKWQWTASTENGKTYELDECDKLDSLEFKSNGEVVDTYFDTVSSENSTCEPASSTSKWSLSGDQLTVTSEFSGVSSTSTGTIKQLTDSTLVLEFIDEDEDENGDETTFVFVDTYKRI
ncbi:lipocalin family protein [Aquimarina sp. W85]|uniref:lipocalin family protein n=1 Tax=Aquimarina rhodophyticola TaxID=3342246 RepID=UPI00366F7DA5